MVDLETQGPTIGTASFLSVYVPSGAAAISASVCAGVQEESTLEMNLKSGRAPLRTNLATLEVPEVVEVSKLWCRVDDMRAAQADDHVSHSPTEHVSLLT